MTDVTVVFVEVDQGDCTLAVDRSLSEGLMIDCPAGKAEEALLELAAQGAARLRVVIATHSDLDHLGGIYPVVTKFPTDLLRLNMAPVVPVDENEKKRLKAALRSIASLPYRGVAIDDARRGNEGQVGDIRWRILTPTLPQLLCAQAKGSPNHASVITHLEVGDCRFLIAGDADAAAWRQMIDGECELRATVFLFPHHGAQLDAGAGVAADELLDAVDAEVVVLSFGPSNAYGHPHVTTLTAIAARRQTFVVTPSACPVLPVQPLQTGTARFAVLDGGFGIK
jgi:competence protein ComEC